MTVIIAFPHHDTDSTVDVPEISETVLHELLRKAVVAHRAGAARAPKSLARHHHLTVSLVLLDAIETVMCKADLAKELNHCLESGTTDIRQLARIARDYDGPESA